jgi:hypothetical protein
MKNDLTTGAWQHNIGCAISITLLSTSDAGSSLTTGELPLFRLLPKVSGANIHWTEHISYLSFSQNSLN